MATLDDLFEQYLSATPPSIEPPSAAVKRAVAAHKDLREDLEKDEKYGPYVARSFLSGSYGRHTAIRYIKDVDVIIQTTFTKEYLAENKRKSETEQEYLLRLTKEAIKRTGRAAGTRTARRSIYVKLPAEINDMGEEEVPELTMDIVPVLIQTKKEKDPMWIADKELCDWFDTYPVTQLDDSEARNGRSAKISGRHCYKPLVKMFKAWKKVHFRSTKTPKGFVLECLTAKYHNPKAKHWVEAVRDLFQNICDEWPNPDELGVVPKVPDISDSSPHLISIAKKVEGAQKVLRKIHKHLALVEQAIEEAESDLMKSAKTLQRVFGKDCDLICFPLPEEDEDKNSESSKRSSPFAARSKSDVREAPRFG